MECKWSHFAKEIILWGIRWYGAYPISYRQLEEMLLERGVAVDHATLNRWVIKHTPENEKQFRHRQRSGGRSWRLDETYVQIKGRWAYLYRAVDKDGHTSRIMPLGQGTALAEVGLSRKGAAGALTLQTLSPLDKTTRHRVASLVRLQ